MQPDSSDSSPSLSATRYSRHQPQQSRVAWLLHCLALLLIAGCATPQDPQIVSIAVVATNDVHGQLAADGPFNQRGGLTTLSGHVRNLRQQKDAVILVDAGDMWQGTLDSNLAEGAAVVEAYNAMGYAAAAIGNHEFDFGPVGPASIPEGDDDDPRGALKARAREARFPLLAANLIDVETGLIPAWDNVQASVMIEAAGVPIGIVGVMTENALLTTIAANVGGLEVTPLAPAIEREARQLRADGAVIVLVVAHAGGRCFDFRDPNDTYSCDLDNEIFKVASALPRGLVDHIAAGHVHHGIAHNYNGIAITANWARTQTFGRVDFLVDKTSGRIIERRIEGLETNCPYKDSDGECMLDEGGPTGPRLAEYEGLAVVPEAAVVEVARRAEAAARSVREAPLGASFDQPLTLKGNPESLAANFMTQALLDSLDADIAIHNVSGGIRAPLPGGELRFGDVYEFFPFDNRIVIVELSGRELRKMIAAQVERGRRRAGFAGMRAHIACNSGTVDVELIRDDGRRIGDDDSLRVIANDFLTLGGDGIFMPVIPEDGFPADPSQPLVRDVLVDWLKGRGELQAERFSSGENPRWRLPAECVQSQD